MATSQIAETPASTADHETYVTLGGQEYLLLPPSYNQARAWRKAFQEPLDRLLGAVHQARDLVGALSIPEGTDSAALLKAFNGVDVGIVIQLFAQVVPELVRAPDLAWDLLMAWSPTLASQADEIGERASDQEILVAFVEVVKQAYPLGTLFTFLGASKSGTPKSSSVPRGKVKPSPMLTPSS